MKKNIDQWLQEYSVSHQHPVNIAIHKVAVPLIVFSLLAMLWPIALPGLGLNAAVLFTVGVLVFYSRLSLSLCLGMLIASTLMLLVLFLLAKYSQVALGRLGLVCFVLGWIFQFIGHKIEGKKPSFFQDILFLFIGPLWTLNFLFKKLGIKV